MLKKTEMEKKEQILDLFYNNHLNQTEIAKIMELSAQYISKVVKKDSRYEQEKAYRKKNRQSYLKDFFKNYKRPKEITKRNNANRLKHKAASAKQTKKQQ